MDDLISRRAAKEFLGCDENHKYSSMTMIEVAALLDEVTAIDAEPVRHGETTSHISTDDIDKYKSRIILDEGEKSKWCRVFYEDDRQHGVWLDTPKGVIKCSECGCAFNLVGMFTHYCPNCGAKMDAKEEKQR